DRSKMRTFERSARVTFYSDGSYGSRELGSTAAEERQTMSAPHYIVAGRGATLAVHGTVKGAVVVYSPERIVVEGNLVYARDTRRATTSMSASSGCAPRVSRSPTDTKSTRGIRSGARLKTIGLRKLRKGYGCRVSDPAPLTDRRAGCTGMCPELAALEILVH